jgi:2-iminobutanoate/2-iminopropanoate deaminase
MPKHQILTTNAPAPGGAYSQALRAGDFVYTAGMGPLHPLTKRVVGETIEEQTAQTLENIKAILAEAGLGMEDVVKTTVHLSDLSLFSRFNETYARFFPDPKPARTTVGSFLLGILVEIDVVAYAGE